MAKILIVGETTDAELDGVTAQLVVAAEKICGERDKVAIAVLGDDVSAAVQQAAALPVDRIYSLTHERLDAGDAGVFDAPVAALATLCAEANPSAVIFARTDFGSNAGPRLAFRLGLPFAQDCIDLALSDSGRIAVTRPVYGGNAMAVFRFNGTGPQIMAIRPNIFEFEGDDFGSAEIVDFDVSEAIGDVRSRLLETVAEERRGIRLEDADLVVSGGRGLGGSEPFERLQQLADLLNGAVGASRAACDAGWIDHGHQIGLTGKSINPRVYITWGISGASQHMAGCSGAKLIVAVNTDPDANIFREARFGVVGDWDKVLTGFAAAVQELTGS